MTPMQRAEAWVREKPSRALDCTAYGKTSVVGLRRCLSGPCVYGEAETLDKAAAIALRQLGVTDFEEGQNA